MGGGELMDPRTQMLLDKISDPESIALLKAKPEPAPIAVPPTDPGLDDFRLNLWLSRQTKPFRARKLARDLILTGAKAAQILRRLAERGELEEVDRNSRGVMYQVVTDLPPEDDFEVCADCRARCQEHGEVKATD